MLILGRSSTCIQNWGGGGCERFWFLFRLIRSNSKFKFEGKIKLLKLRLLEGIQLPFGSVMSVMICFGYILLSSTGTKTKFFRPVSMFSVTKLKKAESFLRS